MEQRQIISFFQIGIVFTIPIFSVLYLAITMPVSYDEACTYLLFSCKGILHTITHYPAPNNHVLYSIFTNISYKLNFLKPLFALRLPAIIFNITTVFVVFYKSKNRFGYNFAICLTAISSVLFMNLYYGYMARGYGFYNLMFIIAFFASYDIIKKQKLNRNWNVFSIASILGFCTIPSFLYPFLILNAWIFLFDYKMIFKQIGFGLLVFSIVYLFYLQIILFEGIQAITKNQYVKSEPFVLVLRALPGFGVKMLNEIIGIHYIMIAALLLYVGYRFYKDNNRFYIKAAVLFATMPFGLLSIQSVIPYVRIFNFYGFLIVFFVLIGFQSHISKARPTLLYVTLAIFQLFMVFNFNYKINEFENKDLAANITASEIISKIIGNKKYFFNKVLLINNFRFELQTKGYSNAVAIENEYLQVSADTILNYDYVILSIDSDSSKLSKPIFSTPYYNVYSPVIKK
jgi:hypothetical protein